MARVRRIVCLCLACSVPQRLRIVVTNRFTPNLSIAVTCSCSGVTLRTNNCVFLDEASLLCFQLLITYFSLLCNGYRGGVKCGRGVLLTTYPLLVPRSWKSRAIPLPTLWATSGPVTGSLYLLPYQLLTYLLHGAESFLRS